MSAPDPLFPGFKIPPNDPRRAVKRQPVINRNPITIRPLPEDYLAEEDEYCERCDNYGYLDCFCGGDLCVCRWQGSRPCPSCGGY